MYAGSSISWTTENMRFISTQQIHAIRAGYVVLPKILRHFLIAAERGGVWGQP